MDLDKNLLKEVEDKLGLEVRVSYASRTKGNNMYEDIFGENYDEAFGNVRYRRIAGEDVELIEGYEVYDKETNQPVHCPGPEIPEFCTKGEDEDLLEGALRKALVEDEVFEVPE